MAVAGFSTFGFQLSKEFLLRQMYVYHCSSIHFRSVLCFYLSSYGEDFSLKRVKITSLHITWMTVNKLYGAILYGFFCIDICCLGEHCKFILL